jgi:hypothetical protein
MASLNNKFYCFFNYPWKAKQKEIRKLKKTFGYMGVRVITDIEDWDKIAVYPERVIIVTRTIKIINRFGLNDGFERLKHDNHVYVFFCNGKIKRKIENRLNVDISNWIEFVNVHTVEKKYFTPEEPPAPIPEEKVTEIPELPEVKSKRERLWDFFNAGLSAIIDVLKSKPIKITTIFGVIGVTVYLIFTLFEIATIEKIAMAIITGAIGSIIGGVTLKRFESKRNQ